ncbi:nicotinamide riboside transporter PnuC [Hymenobacter sp. BT491]|uniref:nicotinamide riboside transporter PnuC n=1 Tax=Hymenobacter sp. BT491 TaxID=2766779 RepID=UPI0016536F10|nr:nicotinamide riboside transporter PnuC [Hymenobacter sp. BT491]MBC6990771.1 nicotinamide mononucleotide transporter [Hymenobacter sp. BT491]
MLHSLYEFWTSAAGNTPLEWVAVLTGLACVWLAAKESIWNFPVAIFSCALYIVVYHRAQLYSDRNLQGIFIAMSLYGWYEWLYGGASKTELPVSRTRPAEWLWLMLAAAAYTVGFGYYLQHHTDAALPHWDSFTTAGSLVAQYQLTRKRLENWLLWIMVDIIYVPILWYKHLYPTSGLYAVYLVLAIYGYFEWRKTMRKEQLAAQSAVVN